MGSKALEAGRLLVEDCMVDCSYAKQRFLKMTVEYRRGPGNGPSERARPEGSGTVTGMFTTVDSGRCGFCIWLSLEFCLIRVMDLDRWYVYCVSNVSLL